VCLQAFPYFLVAAFGHSEGVTVGPRDLAGIFLNLYKLACGSFAERAFLRRVVSCVHITAYGASPFLFHKM
jgi:hypothetical protein